MTLRTLRLSSNPSRHATRLAVALALVCAASTPAHALRLAHSRVVSAPNAPLEVLVGIADLTPDEQRSLMATLADPAAWERAGVTPPVPLSSLTLRLEGAGSPARRNLRITSPEAAKGPAVDLLLDIGTSAGQRQVQLSVMQTAGGFPGLNSQAVVGSGTRSARGASAGAVSVRSGDTLYGIAQSRAVPDATIYQMLVALWRANPQAFIQNNMNLVKAGVTLTVPDAATVRAIDPAEARRIFIEQAEAYARYRASLAGAAARGAAAAAASSASGQVGASTPAAPPAPTTQDRVRLSSGEPGQGDAQAQAQARGDAEVSIARATQDAESRVAELERNVKDLNAALATNQGQGGGASASGNGRPATAGLPGPAMSGGQAGTGRSGDMAAANQGGGVTAPLPSGGAGSSSATAGGNPATSGAAGVTAAPDGSKAANGVGPGATSPSGNPATNSTGSSTAAGSNAAAGSGASGAAAAQGASPTNSAPAGGVAGVPADSNAAAGTAARTDGSTTATPGAPASGAGPASAAPGLAGDASALGGTAGVAGTPGSAAATPGGASGQSGASAGAGIAPSKDPASGISSTATPSGGRGTAAGAGTGAATGPTASLEPGADAGAATTSPADAQGPASGLPAWLSDNLLIVLTAVLALIAFVIAWLLRRAAARREEDQDDLDEELYMSEIDEGAIDRRLEGINLDLDEPPKDDVARRPGVLRP
jgi:pilus assembly protein FimV